MKIDFKKLFYNNLSPTLIIAKLVIVDFKWHTIFQRDSKPVQKRF